MHGPGGPYFGNRLVISRFLCMQSMSPIGHIYFYQMKNTSAELYPQIGHPLAKDEGMERAPCHTAYRGKEEVAKVVTEVRDHDRCSGNWSLIMFGIYLFDFVLLFQKNQQRIIPNTWFLSCWSSRSVKDSSGMYFSSSLISLNKVSMGFD